MANPSKAQDVSAGVMSAIAEELNLDVHVASDQTPEAVAASLDPHQGAPSVDNDPFATRGLADSGLRAPTPRAQASQTASLAPPSLGLKATRIAPANDDRQSVGQILQALQLRPSPLPFYLAGLAGVVWVLAVAIWALPQGSALLASPLLTAILFLGTLIPLGLFGTMAVMAQRSQELRISARSMAEVALRLAEPETAASDHAVSLSQTIRREVAAMGDGIERALSRAGELETVVRSEIANLERAYGENERRLRALIDDLSAEREAILGNAAQVREAIVSAQVELSRDVEHVSERLVHSVTEAGTRVVAMLDDKGGDIGKSLASSGETLVAQIDSYGTDIVSRLSHTGEDITGKLAAASDLVAENLASRVSELDQRLRVTGEALVVDLSLRGNEVAARIDETSARIAETIAVRGDDLAARLADTGNHIHEIVNVRGQALVESLTSSGDTIGEALAQKVAETQALFETSSANHGQQLEEHRSQFAAQMGAYAQDLQNHLSETTSTALETFATQSNLLRDSVINGSREALDTLTAHAEHVAQTAHAQLATFEEIVREHQAHLDVAINEQLGGLGNTLQAQAELLTSETRTAREDLGERLEALRELTSSHTAALTEHTTHLQSLIAHSATETMQSLTGSTDLIAAQFDERLQVISTSLSSQAEVLERTLSERAEALADTLIGGTQSLEQTLADRASDLLTMMGAQGNQIDALLVDRISVLETTLSDYAKTFQDQTTGVDERFASTAGDAIIAIGTHTDRIIQVLGDRLAAFEDVVSTQGSALADRVDGHATRFTDGVMQGLASVEAIFATHGDAFHDRLSARSLEVSDMLDGRLQDFDSRTTGKAEEIRTSLETLLSRIEEGLDSRGLSVSEALANRAEDINRAMTEASDTIQSRGSEVSELLETRISDISKTLQDQITALNETLDERGFALNDMLSGRSGELQHLFDEKAPLLVDILSARGSEIAAEITRVSEEATATLEDRSAILVQQIGDKQSQLAATLDESTATLRETIEAGANQSIEALTETNARVRQELTDTLDRLGDANEVLNEIINKAGTNLSSIETSLSTRVKDFQTAIGTVALHITSLQQTSIDALTGAESLASRLTESNDILSQVTHHIVETQQDVEESLERRRASIAELVENVSTKADSFEQILGSFTTVLNEALRRAEARAQEIAAFLQDHSKDVGGVISARYEEIRHESETERERTALALRSAYEQAMAEMQQVFGTSVERFRTAAAEMRNVSAEVQRELETTRHELRIGATELPREVTEQTAAMRRVVAEQVRALAELSEIVTRSGRSLDVAEANHAGARGGRSTDTFREADSFRTPPAPSRRPDLTRPVETGREESSRRSSPASAAVPRAPIASQPLVPVMDRTAVSDRGPGWLSDLLARASTDEPAAPSSNRSDPRAADLLDNLSRDITRLVDHEAVADLWANSAQGERNTATQRLYTRRGQQAFQDVRARYRSDMGFRQTVDQYVEEFERLVSDIGRDDRDGLQVRSYLTSETGKVYTLLAHAAGRLD